MSATYDDRDLAKFMNNYARAHAAGAFATPTAKEIGELRRTGNLNIADRFGLSVLASKTITRDSWRVDWTGQRFSIPRGFTMVTHVAADQRAVLPDLGWAHGVTAYLDDENVTGQLRQRGRTLMAVKISAASELIGMWADGAEVRYGPLDTATLRRIPIEVPDEARAAIMSELSDIQGWHDDYPFYSDGSWSAVSLRGFNPADPSWGVKPAEMPKSWHEQHPGADRMVCDWTVLAQRTPAIVDFINSVKIWGRMERVRLLRMAGKTGKPGALGRHTDITDRASGPGDGQIVRFHVPLLTDERAKMTAWDLSGRSRTVHLPQWSCWYLDARKPHSVVNASGRDRIHLVVDVIADSDVREAILLGEEAA
jgi:hypothetical protein